MAETDAIGLRLLSLDGGGIRGLSILLILQTIMHRIKTEESLEDTPHPCDYFDLIGGTSTGGIIALMLGRLRMSVKDAIDCYDSLAGKVFSKLNRWGDDKYKAELLEEVIKEIVKERTGDRKAPVLDDGALGGICKTFVCAMNAHNMNARIPVLFRTYESPKEPSIPCTVWQAARATSAAPSFFGCVSIGPTARPEPFIDGGVGLNNPIAQVLKEAELIFPDRNIACVISIGTGKPGTIDVPNPGFLERNMVPVGVIKAMVAMATDCEETAQRMEKKFELWPKVYFRFNVEQGLQKVKLGDWDRMGEVAGHTRNYINMHEVDQRLATAVKAIRERKGGIKTLAINTIPNQLSTIHGPAGAFKVLEFAPVGNDNRVEKALKKLSDYPSLSVVDTVSCDGHIFAAKPALPTFNEGSQYVILNCATDKALVLLPGFCPGRDLYLVQPFLPVSIMAPNRVLFTLKVQAGGGVALHSTHLGKWAGPNFSAHSTEHSFYFIASGTNKDWFSICPDLAQSQAFYDSKESCGYFWDYWLYLGSFNANDPRQMWRLIPK